VGWIYLARNRDSCEHDETSGSLRDYSIICLGGPMKGNETLSQDSRCSCKYSKRTIQDTGQKIYRYTNMLGHDIEIIIAVHHWLKLMAICKQSDVNYNFHKCIYNFCYVWCIHNYFTFILKVGLCNWFLMSGAILYKGRKIMYSQFRCFRVQTFNEHVTFCEGKTSRS
jgi:hypothetical protein